MHLKLTITAIYYYLKFRVGKIPVQKNRGHALFILFMKLSRFTTQHRIQELFPILVVMFFHCLSIKQNYLINLIR